ncbi:hypothetical protein IB286_06065 [Spongiibacter sp. KMU-158]|uniref:Toxin CptA n=1 Tax=Spongiibacter pelagi TaxID=2760804 RepID=A0A927GVE1_9GAMM|nr:protein YgfX [Spongiibacter pelagi]MBD2858571.1 hypothetical protein [Spongiibacter pelagi]
MRLVASPRFDLSPSFILQIYLLLVAGVFSVILLCWLTVVSDRPHLLALGLVMLGGGLVYLLRALRSARLRLPRSIIGLCFRQGEWQLMSREGERQIGVWLGVRILPWVVVLHLAPDEQQRWRRRYLPIFRDQLAAEQWRQLRVFCNAAPLCSES